MLVLVCIVHLWIRFCFTFPLKARRGLNRQNCSLQNSAQDNTVQSRTPRSVSHFWIFGKLNCRLRAVLANLDSQKIFEFFQNIIIGTQIPWKWRYSKIWKNLLTPRSVSLRRVQLHAGNFREYLRKNKFLSKTILACLSGAQMASFHEIKKLLKILWHCPFNVAV